MPAPRPLSDTDADIAARQLEAFRRMTHGEKLAQVGALTAAAYQLEVAGLRLREPGLTGAALQRRLVERRLGVDMVLRVYGPEGDRREDPPVARQSRVGGA